MGIRSNARLGATFFCRCPSNGLNDGLQGGRDEPEGEVAARGGEARRRPPNDAATLQLGGDGGRGAAPAAMRQASPRPKGRLIEASATGRAARRRAIFF